MSPNNSLQGPDGEVVIGYIAHQVVIHVQVRGRIDNGVPNWRRQRDGIVMPRGQTREGVRTGRRRGEGLRGAGGRVRKNDGVGASTRGLIHRAADRVGLLGDGEFGEVVVDADVVGIEDDVGDRMVAADHAVVARAVHSRAHRRGVKLEAGRLACTVRIDSGK